MKQKKGFWIALWIVLVVITGYFAFFHASLGMGYGPWHGWNRGAGWGDGFYPAYRPGGWHGMEFGEFAMGSGMPGRGGGMRGYDLPQLSPEQAEKAGKLRAEQFERSRALMPPIWETQARLNGLYAADKPDWNAIRDTTRRLYELQRQRQESVIEFQRGMDGLLSDAQRQELARSQRGCGWMGRPD